MNDLVIRSHLHPHAEMRICNHYRGVPIGVMKRTVTFHILALHWFQKDTPIANYYSSPQHSIKVNLIHHPKIQTCFIRKPFWDFFYIEYPTILGKAYTKWLFTQNGGIDDFSNVWLILREKWVSNDINVNINDMIKLMYNLLVKIASC